LEEKVTMLPKENDFYSIAHLFVAAIRVCEHRNGASPSLEEVCKFLSFSMERGNFICRKLKEIQIIDVIGGSYGDRLFIRNHIKLEEIPRGAEDTKFEEELKKFKDAQKAFSQKIESFQAEQAAKKKNRFAEMEKKLKQELEKKSKPQP
jgi:hypothetical protein